ncbi:Katanin p80 WD40 repeat-containing subunit B1 [Gracilariopsis chorda]|uniref:Katanin p80 WD40 repeat-containing subunit B1 n=1 Tax=Gracilariopsis chorda TaxID=448386 RepID=A0A2V3J9E0_9FLOR|nr:Katanin p80 WD40 repeat-containing subunit B1 [Gracilariopsis chorda]|eukprot:PXF50177.1 Katanin p80 WD40 repeat-containing subunit B1 [Gracilariopsis chorda]
MTSKITVKKRWQLSRYVDAVVSAGGGNAVAATSQITGIVWDGCVHGLMGAGQIEAEIEVETGIADLCCLDEGQFIAGADDGSVRVVHSGGVLPLPGGHNSNVNSVAVSSSKKLVASGGQDKAVLCWNLNEPSNEPMRFEGHIDSVNSVDWNTTGDNLLTASSDGMACVWDERQNHWQAAITIPTGLDVYSAVFAASGTTMVMSTEMMDVVAFDLRAETKALWRKGGYTGASHCLRASPHNEKIVAVASNCPAVTLLDVSNGNVLGKSFHHTDYVRSVAWDSQAEGRLFSGSWDKSVAELNVSL